MKKKPKLLLPATLPQGATDEQQKKFAKERLILTVIKTVYAGLMLLLIVLALFVPCYSYVVNPEYTQGKSVKYSISTVHVLSLFASTYDEQKAELDIIKNTGETAYMQPKATKSYKNRTAPSESQVVQEIEYRKKMDLSLVERMANIYRFIDVMNQNISDYINTFIGITSEKRAELADAGKELIIYLVNNFREEIEQRNFSGLHFFMRNVAVNIQATGMDNFADKYLLNTYSSVQELPDKCIKMIGCIPYYYESFSFTSEESSMTLTVTIDNEEYIITSSYGNYTFTLIMGTILVGIFVLVNLICLILTTVSVVKMYVKKDYPFKRSFFNLSMLGSIVLFLLTQLVSTEKILLSAASIGAIFIMIFSVMSLVSLLLYNERLMKAKQRYFENEIASDTVDDSQ